MTNKIFIKFTKGGTGSGHRGHSGRPGKRGGSAPGKGGGPVRSEAFQSGQVGRDERRAEARVIASELSSIAKNPINKGLEESTELSNVGFSTGISKLGSIQSKLGEQGFKVISKSRMTISSNRSEKWNRSSDNMNVLLRRPTMRSAKLEVTVMPKG